VKKILLVEDESVLRKSLERFLRRKEHEVLVTADYDEASPLLRTGSINLLIADLVLPSGKGFALIEEAKNASSRVKIIVMTAYGSQAVKKRLLRLGVFGYLEKPFDLAALSSLVEEALSTKPEEGDGGESCRVQGGRSGLRPKDGPQSPELLHR